MSKKQKFSKLFKMKPYSRKFYKAQQDFFNLKPNIEVLKTIGMNRKNNYSSMKQYMKMTEVFEFASNDTKYLNAMKERDIKMMSGEYLHERANLYINNYLRALKAMTIDQRIIDYIDENPNIILEGLLPEIDNYYVYLNSNKRTPKGNKYKVNIDEATTFENKIIDTLKDIYKVDFSDVKKEE